MKNKLTALLLAAAMVVLTGCQLAREPSEQENANSALAQARFMGVYVVREDLYAELDRTHWVEYGSYTADTEIGNLEIPGEILVAQRDESTHKITFPGMKGVALFAYEAAGSSGHSYTAISCDLSDGQFKTHHTDAGESYDLSGTLYYGPPADDPGYDPWEDDRVWHHYKVYQMADGTIFLNGYGDSHSGGGGMGLTQTETYTTTVNGEKMEYYTRVEVNVEYIERLTALTVRQYGSDGQLLQTVELPVEGDIPVVDWLPDAEWLVVEELRGGELTRTAYDRPSDEEETVSHQVILLGDDGMGYVGSIRFE